MVLSNWRLLKVKFCSTDSKSYSFVSVKNTTALELSVKESQGETCKGCVDSRSSRVSNGRLCIIHKRKSACTSFNITAVIKWLYLFYSQHHTDKQSESLSKKNIFPLYMKLYNVVKAIKIVFEVAQTVQKEVTNVKGVCNLC